MNRQLCFCFAVFLCVAWSVSVWGMAPVPPANDETRFKILYSGTPDAYGNQILNVSVAQDLGGSWKTRGVITSTNYSGSNTITGYYNQSVLFTVWTRLNYTFVTSGSAAKAGSKVFIRIGSVVAFTEMTADDVDLISIPQGWLVKHTYLWDDEGYPKITTYTITLRYSSIGSIDNLLQNPNDLGITGGQGFDRGIDGSLTTEQGVLNYPCGYWYTTLGAGADGYIYDAGFRPFHNARSLTIELWFMVIEGAGSGSGLPSQDGHNFYLFGEYNAYATSFYAGITTGNQIYGRITTGGTAEVDISTGVTVELYTLYQLVFTWQTGDKPAMYVNNSQTLGASNLTGAISANVDFYIGRLSSGNTNYGNLLYLDVAIWNRSLSSTEVGLEYAAGPEGGSVYATQLNNSWSFNEYSSGLYAKAETTVHDGLGTFGVRETWTFYGTFSTLAVTLAPNPLVYPEVYIWLGGWALMPLGVAYAKIRGESNADEKPLHWGIGFIILIFGIVIVVSGV